MRAVAFALSLLVLGSVGAAAQQASPMASSEEFNLNPRDVAAIGVGALVGFFGVQAIPVFLGAEAVAVPGFVGAVAGGIVGAWWYSDHDNQEYRPEIKPTAARPAVARQGQAPTLIH